MTLQLVGGRQTVAVYRDISGAWVDPRVSWVRLEEGHVVLHGGDYRLEYPGQLRYAPTRSGDRVGSPITVSGVTATGHNWEWKILSATGSDQPVIITKLS